ncbi:CHAT domain-containing protein [Salinivirga cyanobacteriivorans]
MCSKFSVPQFFSKVLLLFLFCCIANPLLSQYYPFYFELRALSEYPVYQEYNEAISLYNEDVEVKKVNHILDSLADSSLKDGQIEQYLFLENEKANLLKQQHQYLEAYDILKKSMAVFSARRDTVHIEYFTSQRLLRTTLYRIKNIPGKENFQSRTQEEIYQSMFDVLEGLDEDGKPLRNTLVDYGLHLLRKGKNKQAIDILYKARNLALEANDLSSLALSDYSIIGNMQSSFDLLQTKNEVMENDIKLFESQAATIPVLMYNAYFITKVSQNYYQHFNNLDKAIAYANRAAKLLDTLPYPAYNIKAATHGNLANYYAEKGDEKKMWAHLNIARKLVEEKSMSAYNRAFGYTLISEAASFYAPDTAMAFLDVLDTLPGKKFFANRAAEIKANVLVEKGHIDEAKELILTAFDSLTEINGQKVPLIASSREYAEQYYLLDLLQSIYMQLESVRDEDYTPVIVKLIDLQNSLFKKIMAEDIYGFEISGLSEEYDAFLDENLAFLLNLPTQAYFEQTMNLALTSKALHLNTLMNKNRYQSVLEGDSTLFGQVMESARKVQEARNKLANAKTEGGSDLADLEMKLNSELIDNLMLRYSIDEQYRNTDIEVFEGNINIASISQVKSKLMTDEALIEYYMLDSSWAQLLVLPDTAMFFYHKGVKLHDKIEAERYSVLTGRETTDIGEIIFENLSPYLKDINKLVIVPDANLNYIPFERLKVNDEMLIRSFSISYSYSSVLWYNLRKENSFSHPESLLAIAPLFDDFSDEPEAYYASEYRGEGGLSALPYSLEEVNGIKGQVSATLQNVVQLKGKEAQLDKVKAELPNYDILHFATHGLVNRKYPERSGLYLYENNTKNNTDVGLLSLGELFNMRLNADLMVLSACNSGRGDYLDGEGVMALPRGGILSGVPRVVASLWAVHDERTKDIMLSFYNYLNEGYAYREALRLAKLDAIEAGFLDKNWAGFILIGA